MSRSAKRAPTTILFIVVVTMLFMVPALPADAAEGPEVEIAKLTASDGATGHHFGESVAVSGNTAVVGSQENDLNGERSGAAYVFTRSGESWTQTAILTPSDAAPGQVFGDSVAISGDTVLVGATGDSDNGSWAGAAYVFTRTGTTWTQEAKLKPSDGAPGDNIGNSVAISGDTALLGAHLKRDEGEPAGSAYVFNRVGSSWTQQARLSPSNSSAAWFFGLAVSVSGDTVAVGAPTDRDDGRTTGSVYVYSRSGTTWRLEAKLGAPDTGVRAIIGDSITVSGDTLVIGRYGNSSVGEAHVFTRNSGTWTHLAQLTAADGAVADYFGRSVAADGDTLLIGASGASDNEVRSGSAYVFTRDDNTWTQHAKLTPSDGAANDGFGTSAAMAGNTAVVGSIGDDDNGDEAGSAYVFGPDPTLRIGTDTTLTEDHSGNVVITANDVTLDCAGHSITGSGHAGVELATRSGVTVANCDIHGFNHGIYVEHSSGNTFVGNTSTNAVYHGFSLWYSTGNTVTANTGVEPGHHSFVTVDSDDNVFEGNTANGGASTQGFHIVHGSDRNQFLSNNAIGNDIGFAIAITGGHDNVLTGNHATSNNVGFLLADGATSNELRANTAANNDFGFHLDNAQDNVLADNVARDNARWGIVAWGSAGNEFIGNDSTGNGYDGIHLGEGSDGNTVAENVTTGNDGAGIATYRADGNEFRDNTSTGNGEWGLILNESSRNVAEGNAVSDSGQTGLVVWANPEATYGSNSNTLIDNVVSGSTYEGLSVGGQAADNQLVGNLFTDNGGVGIHLGEGSVDNVISGNSTTGNQEGISQYRATGSTITDNIVAGNTFGGIVFGESHGNMVANNVSSENGERGFALWQSDANTIRDNIATDNELDGFLVWESSTNTLVGNAATGHDKDGTDGTYGTGFFLGYATDTTMEGNTAKRNYHGIRLDFSDDNALTENVALMNVVGFDIVESNSNRLDGNVAEHNGDRAGFELRQGSSDNVLTRNVARYTYQWAGFAVYDAFDNDFIENIAEHNKIGFGVWEPATGNVFTENFARNAWLDAMDATPEGANTWNGNDFKWVEGDGGWR